MVTRGAEQRDSLWTALGGWQLAPAPPRRAAPRTPRLISLAALLLAGVVAIAALFLTRSDQPAALPAATAATAPTSAAPTVPPPPAVSSSAPQRATAPTASAASDRASAVAAQQASVNQAAVEQAVAAEQRAVTLATSDEAEAQIRSYIGIRPTTMLPPAFSYIIEPGDTVSKIAARFGLQEATIRFNNFDIYDPDLLEVGASIQLPVRDGVIYVVQSHDTLSGVLENYAAELDATLAFPGNGISSPDHITVGQTLLLVGGSASVAAGGYSGAGAGGTWSMPTFAWPMAVTSISDPFGVPRGNSYGYHTGVDWPAPIGTIVGSTATGVVSYAGWDGGYGYWVEVDHGGGVRSRYAHLNEIFVVVGAWVATGDYVGAVGNTGRSTGAHLHFEIIMSGQPVNPYEWLQ